MSHMNPAQTMITNAKSGEKKLISVAQKCIAIESGPFLSEASWLDSFPLGLAATMQRSKRKYATPQKKATKQ